MKNVKWMALLLGLVALPFQPLVYGQSEAQADGFVRHIYAQYSSKTGKESGPDFLGRGANAVFSADLLRLIRHDEKTTPRGDVGKLDFDPICSCQDFSGLQLKELRVVKDNPSAATAFATLFFGPPSDSSVVKLRLRLIWTPQGWRIDDIESRDTPSLRKYLQ